MHSLHVMIVYEFSSVNSVERDLSLRVFLVHLWTINDWAEYGYWMKQMINRASLEIAEKFFLPKEYREIAQKATNDDPHLRPTLAKIFTTLNRFYKNDNKQSSSQVLQNCQETYNDIKLLKDEKYAKLEIDETKRDQLVAELYKEVADSDEYPEAHNVIVYIKILTPVFIFL
ncbi:kinase-like domain-containing protein [Rhizophagus clarus]|uniref:Kinase-like domain-containing protein n=1 Tax=Rhizophagus clarus TaxID=94130 RepID=A0A8H3L202_9GLOM|nr:kinase-like domain-containing protein [Rhizophagus clarus]